MDRTSLRGILVLLSVAGVLAPAGEMIARRNAAPAAEAVALAEGAEKPRLSPEELRRAVELLEKQAMDTGAEAERAGRSRVTVPDRDPFSLPPLPPSTAAPPPPAVRLLGIVGSGERGVATLVVDGQVVTMQVGQTVGEVRLMRVEAPGHAAEMVDGKMERLGM